MRIRVFALSAVMTASTGCYKNTIATGLQPGASSDHKAKFYIFGLVGEADFDLDNICPSGISKIVESQEVPDVLLSCITCSIYTPVSVKITCASGTAWNLVPDEVNNRTLVVAVDSSPSSDQGA